MYKLFQITVIIQTLDFLVVVNSGHGENKSCIVDEIAVMEDFDMSKMYGLWYETFWIPAFFEKPEEVWGDFTEEWSAGEDQATTLVKARGRPTDNASCSLFTKKYLRIPGEKAEAKWVTPRRINATYVFPMDAWVIGADYEGYSLIYGCTTRAADGTCAQHHGWLWSRTPVLSTEDVEAITGLLPGLCLTWDHWLETPQGESCTGARRSAGFAALPSVLLVLLAAGGAVVQGARLA